MYKLINIISLLNIKLLKNNEFLINFINNCKLPGLNDAWLSGFTDGEGCFSVSKLKTFFIAIYNINQKYLVNKYVLEHILNMLREIINIKKQVGSIYKHSNKSNNVFEIRIGSIEACSKLRLYFNKYPLKSYKLEVYKDWLNFIDVAINNNILKKNRINQLNILLKIIRDKSKNN